MNSKFFEDLKYTLEDIWADINHGETEQGLDALTQVITMLGLMLSEEEAMEAGMATYYGADEFNTNITEEDN